MQPVQGPTDWYYWRRYGSGQSRSSASRHIDSSLWFPSSALASLHLGLPPAPRPFHRHISANFKQPLRTVNGRPIVAEAVLEPILLPRTQQFGLAANGKLERRSRPNVRPHCLRWICHRLYSQHLSSVTEFAFSAGLLAWCSWFLTNTCAQMGRQVWKIQSCTLPESPCDQSEERTCNTPKGSTDVVPTGAWKWSKNPLCCCSVANFGRMYTSSLQARRASQFFLRLLERSSSGWKRRLDSSCTTRSTRWSAHIWPIFWNAHLSSTGNNGRRGEGTSGHYSGRVNILLVLSAPPVTKLIFLWLAAVLRSRCVTQRLLKKYYLFNKRILYLVDDIWWYMGFNSADRQEEVVIWIICIIKVIEIIWVFFRSTVKRTSRRKTGQRRVQSLQMK